MCRRRGGEDTLETSQQGEGKGGEAKVFGAAGRDGIG